MREWLGRIGVSVGGKSDRSVREQAERISRCRLTFHLLGTNGAGLVNQSIVDKALFIEADRGEERQGRLSLEAAHLSEGFFEQLNGTQCPLKRRQLAPCPTMPKLWTSICGWLIVSTH
jgi:hypothetical protein